jgi:pectinesterase
MKYTVDNTVLLNKIINNCKDGDIIELKAGFYTEKVEIYKSNITIIGESKETTIITNNDYYHKILSDFNECNTFRTYSVYVGGNNVTFKNITIENSCNQSHIYGQAVALHVNGDNFKCEDCIIRSAQDTLFTGPLPKDLIERHNGLIIKPEQLLGTPSRQIYKHCTIKGDVDFIFGCATALFDECDIVSVARHKTGANNIDGFICAPSHPKELEYGYLFYKCNLLCEPGVTNVYLGRPWRDYGAAAFILCNMDNHINPEGYDPWNPNRINTCRFIEYTENIDLKSRKSWINIYNKEKALEYVEQFNNYLIK